MNQKMLVHRFLQKNNLFAVIGVSRNRRKYGYRVWRNLRDSGYLAYPINPNAAQIDGEKCYKSLSKLPEIPDVVELVVPPSVSEKAVKECKSLGIKMVWMQPGSETEKAISFCEKNGIKVLSKICVMMESDQKREARKDKEGNQELQKMRAP